MWLLEEEKKKKAGGGSTEDKSIQTNEQMREISSCIRKQEEE